MPCGYFFVEEISSEEKIIGARKDNWSEEVKLPRGLGEKLNLYTRID